LTLSFNNDFESIVGAAPVTLLMGSSRKNGRLGDPALPSLSSASFHVKHFHPKFLESPPLGQSAVC
jgi:hypothetical protein